MRAPLKPLSEQVIVITGASSGIGLVTARRAATAGAKVMLVARNEDALREIAESLKAAGFEADFAVADVGVREDVEAAAQKTVGLWGRIDTWVNNAGASIFAKAEDTPFDEHERLFRTNYFGVVHGSLTALKYLREGGGALITTGSILSDMPAPLQAAYAASKHAVKGFIESLRMELVAEGAPVSVTLVKPSGIDTPIAERAAAHLDGRARIPPPVYDPVLVARAILHAAEHPRRSITVGGGGRAQVLLANHFPQALDRMAPLLIPAVVKPGEPHRNGPGDLFRPHRGGDERSDEQSGFRISPYTEAQLHPLATAAVVGAAVLGLGALMMRGRNGRSGTNRAAERLERMGPT